MDALTLLAAHMVGDYILQTHHQAIHKLTSPLVRAAHVTTYTLCFIPSAWLAGLSLSMAALFLALVWVTHFIVDSRRWASGEQWTPKPILVDQAIHLVVLAVLAQVFGGN